MRRKRRPVQRKLGAMAGLVVLLGTVAAAQAAVDDPWRQTMEETLAEWQAPGAVLVIVEEGVVAHARAYGSADVESGRPVDFERTIFRLGSISKPVSAVMAARLAEAGRLDLERPVVEYVSAYPGLVERLKRGAAGPALTTEHLLTHTGGFEDRFFDRLSRSVESIPDLGAFLSRQMPARLYPPGEVSAYSNHGLALAGLVAAEAAGKPFGEAARDWVFEPAGMRRSSFALDRTLEADLAQGYRFGRSVEPMGIKTVPASMLFSTGSDMARLMVGLVDGENRLLSEAATKSLFARRFGGHPSHPGRALGWVEDSSVSPRRLFHSGGVDGFSSGIVLVPERRGGVFVAMNGNAWVWGLLREVLDARFPATPVVSATPAAARRVERSNAAELAGRWAPVELPRTTFDRARLLFEQTAARAEGEAIVFDGRRYEPAADGSFRADEGGSVVFDGATADRPAFLVTANGAYRKLGWHEAWPWHLGLLIAFSSLFAALAVDRPLRLSRQRLPARAGRWLRGSALLNLLFVIAIGSFIGIAMAQDGGVLRFGIPWYLIAILCLPFAGAACAVAAGVVALTGPWDSRSLVPVALGAVLSLSFLPFVAYWNLLGFNF